MGRARCVNVLPPLRWVAGGSELDLSDDCRWKEVLQSGKGMVYIYSSSKAVGKRTDGGEQGGATHKLRNKVLVVLERIKTSRAKMFWGRDRAYLLSLPTTLCSLETSFLAGTETNGRTCFKEDLVHTLEQSRKRPTMRCRHQKKIAILTARESDISMKRCELIEKLCTVFSSPCLL